MEQSEQGMMDLVRVTGLNEAMAVLFGTWLVARVVTGVFEAIGKLDAERGEHLRTLARLTRGGLYLAGCAVAIGVSFNVANAVAIALVGLAIVVVTFASKDFVASLLAGVTFLVERPYRVGDRIAYGELRGEITQIGLRSLRFVMCDGSIVTVPNHKLLGEVARCSAAGATQVQMDFFIAPNQDAPIAKSIVEEAIQCTRFASPSKPWEVLVSQALVHGYVTIRLRARLYALDAQYEHALESDVTERVLEGFARHAIAMPNVALLEQRTPHAPSLGPQRK